MAVTLEPQYADKIYQNLPVGLRNSIKESPLYPLFTKHHLTPARITEISQSTSNLLLLSRVTLGDPNRSQQARLTTLLSRMFLEYRAYSSLLNAHSSLTPSAETALRNILDAIPKEKIGYVIFFTLQLTTPDPEQTGKTLQTLARLSRTDLVKLDLMPEIRRHLALLWIQQPSKKYAAILTATENILKILKETPRKTQETLFHLIVESIKNNPDRNLREEIERARQMATLPAQVLDDLLIKQTLAGLPPAKQERIIDLILPSIREQPSVTNRILILKRAASIPQWALDPDLFQSARPMCCLPYFAYVLGNLPDELPPPGHIFREIPRLICEKLNGTEEEMADIIKYAKELNPSSPTERTTALLAMATLSHTQRVDTPLLTSITCFHARRQIFLLLAGFHNNPITKEWIAQLKKSPADPLNFLYLQIVKSFTPSTSMHGALLDLIKQLSPEDVGQVVTLAHILYAKTPPDEHLSPLATLEWLSLVLTDIPYEKSPPEETLDAINQSLDLLSNPENSAHFDRPLAEFLAIAIVQNGLGRLWKHDRSHLLQHTAERTWMLQDDVENPLHPYKLYSQLCQAVPTPAYPSLQFPLLGRRAEWKYPELHHAAQAHPILAKHLPLQTTAHATYTALATSCLDLQEKLETLGVTAQFIRDFSAKPEILSLMRPLHDSDEIISPDVAAWHCILHQIDSLPDLPSKQEHFSKLLLSITGSCTPRIQIQAYYDKQVQNKLCQFSHAHSDKKTQVLSDLHKIYQSFLQQTLTNTSLIHEFDPTPDIDLGQQDIYLKNRIGRFLHLAEPVHFDAYSLWVSPRIASLSDQELLTTTCRYLTPEAFLQEALTQVNAALKIKGSLFSGITSLIGEAPHFWDHDPDTCTFELTPEGAAELIVAAGYLEIIH